MEDRVRERVKQAAIDISGGLTSLVWTAARARDPGQELDKAALAEKVIEAEVQLQRGIETALGVIVGHREGRG